LFVCLFVGILPTLLRLSLSATFGLYQPQPNVLKAQENLTAAHADYADREQQNHDKIRAKPHLSAD
jgi:hypothetical protein